jgi:perosamine synthetase
MNKTRRDFLKTTSAVAVGAAAFSSSAIAADSKKETLAINGGPKTVTEKLDARWPRFSDKAVADCAKLIADYNYGTIDKFEEAWKTHFKVPFAKAHVNGTSALGASFFALDLPVGSEVLVTSYSTWFPISPARLLGVVPKLCDCDPNTLNIDLEDAKKKLSPKVKAIMPVHWWGLPCDMEAICDFAKEKGLQVIEDCSHAHGSKINDTYIGSWGRIGAFSLQGSKPLPSIEGGIAVFKERRDYERATLFGHYRHPSTYPADSPYRKYDKTAFGSKLRMHPVSAILAKDQLGALDANNKAIISSTKRLNERICQLPGLKMPAEVAGSSRVYYNSNMLLFDEKKAGFSRIKCAQALSAEGVPTQAYGWTSLHEFPYLQEGKWWAHKPVIADSYPGCDRANETSLSVALFRTDQPELVEQYARAFEKVWANRDKLV